MKNKHFYVLMNVTCLSLASCSSSDGVRWKLYASDHDLLATCQNFQTEYPFKITGEAIASSEDKFRLVLTFDSCTVEIPEIRIMVQPYDYNSSYSEDSAKVPFLGYGPKYVGLGPTRDSIKAIYPGLNIAFEGQSSNPNVKISVHNEDCDYYIQFNNFVLKEVQL